MGSEPESAGGGDRICSNSLPPIDFIAAVVNFAVMPPAEWDRELIANFASESAALGKSQMVSN
jgi:hypothetical protein